MRPHLPSSSLVDTLPHHITHTLSPSLSDGPVFTMSTPNRTLVDVGSVPNSVGPLAWSLTERWKPSHLRAASSSATTIGEGE